MINKILRNINLKIFSGQELTSKETEIINILKIATTELHEYHAERYPDSIFYGKDINTIIFEYDNNRSTLWISLTEIILPLRKKLNSTYPDIKDLVGKYIAEKLNINIENFHIKSKRHFSPNLTSK